MGGPVHDWPGVLVFYQRLYCSATQVIAPHHHDFVIKRWDAGRGEAGHFLGGAVGQSLDDDSSEQSCRTPLSSPERQKIAGGEPLRKIASWTLGVAKRAISKDLATLFPRI
jgi:hypothetical protein